MPYGMTDSEYQAMVERDRQEFFAYLEKLAHWNWLEEAGQRDADMRKPEPPAFCGELEF